MPLVGRPDGCATAKWITLKNGTSIDAKERVQLQEFGKFEYPL